MVGHSASPSGYLGSGYQCLAQTLGFHCAGSIASAADFLKVWGNYWALLVPSSNQNCLMEAGKYFICVTMNTVSPDNQAHIMSHRLIDNENHKRELSDTDMKQPATTRTFESFRPLKLALKDCSAWIKGWRGQEGGRAAKDVAWRPPPARTTPA